jgi:integrase
LFLRPPANTSTADEEEKLHQHLAEYGEHKVALVELDLETGMRLGELLNARWSDVDTHSKAVRVTMTKTDKPRVVPLTDKALRPLQALRQDAPEHEMLTASKTCSFA